MFFLFAVILLFSPDVRAHFFSIPIQNKNVDKINDLISHGYDVNFHEGGEHSPLIDSLISGNLDITLILLNAGANPNGFDYSSFNRIKHVLSYAKSISEIVLLLSYGANPYDDNFWERNDAEGEQRQLHLIIYQLWPFFDEKIVPPATVQELNELIFMLPFLKIFSLLKSLEHGYLNINMFLTEESKRIVNDAGILF